MNKFWHLISPNTIPANIDPGDDLAVMRERILQFILLIACPIGLVVVVTNIPVVIKNNTFGLLIMYLVLYIWLLWITIDRKHLSYRVRALGFLLIPYLVGLTGLLEYGLAGNGRLFLLALTIMATALVGLGAGSATSFLCIITIIIAAVVRTSTNPLMNSNLDVEPGADWVSAIFVYIMLTALTTGMIQIILYGLQAIVFRQKELAAELNNERGNLADQVERRTQQLVNRASQLEAANKISQIIATETNFEKLCQKVVDQITDQLNFYYASIFLLDERKEFAVMQAGTGDAGKALLARHHSLKVGEIGMVGYVVSRGEIKVAQNVFLDPIHYKNPLLPETRSEIAIPLIAGGQILGALDVQSVELEAFTSENSQTLQTVADQMATALDRFKLEAQLRETRGQLEGVYRQFTQSAWKTFLKGTRASTSYRYRKSDGAVTQVDPIPGETNENAALAKDQQTISTQMSVAENGEPVTNLAIPVMLRNQILGVINVRIDGERVSKDSLSLLEAASSRLAIALENARLLEESQSRANREHLVSDISARVRGSTEVSGILQTAAQELGRVLGVSEVLVQLRSSGNE